MESLPIAPPNQHRPQSWSREAFAAHEAEIAAREKRENQEIDALLARRHRLSAQEFAAELKKWPNLLILNTACHSCIKDGVHCRRDQDAQACERCAKDEHLSESCNAHGLIPAFTDARWPCAAAVVFMAAYRHTALSQFFAVPDVSRLIDSAKHLNGAIKRYKKLGTLPDWCPAVGRASLGETDKTSIEVEDLSAELVKRVYEWDEWGKVQSPSHRFIAGLEIRVDWLEAQAQAQTRGPAQVTASLRCAL